MNFAAPRSKDLFPNVPIQFLNMYIYYLMGASEVSANLYCNLRTSVLGRLRDYLRLLMGRTLHTLNMLNT